MAATVAEKHKYIVQWLFMYFSFAIHLSGGSTSRGKHMPSRVVSTRFCCFFFQSDGINRKYNPHQLNSYKKGDHVDTQ
jgi:hypothetical protein